MWNRFNVRTIFKIKHTLRGTLMKTEPVTITGFSDFVHRLVFEKLQNTTFRKRDLFQSSGGRGIPTLLGPLERDSI
jgi:hypothetical protein